jgi:enterobactin synthetase component D
MPTEALFRLDLPHGRCVGIRVPATVGEGLLAYLPGEEQAYAETVGPARKGTFVAGRLALREALRDLGLEAPPILPDKRGAPDLRGLATGSISHKPTLAVGLAAPAGDGLSVGVDIEPLPLPDPAPGDAGWDRRPDISRRVMTPRELAILMDLPAERRRLAILLCFSIKEALYKALNPLIRRYVSFQEATVLPAADGSVELTLALAKGEGPFTAEARWSEIAGHLLTTARVRPAG